MSGDMCTSLGNGLTNLILALFITQEQTGDYRKLQGIFEGDDGLFKVPFEITSAMFAKLGFTIKIETGDLPNEMAFCQNRFATIGQNVKALDRVISDFGWTHSVIGCGERCSMALLRAKALSLCYELPHCPIVRALGQRALALTRGITPRFEYDWYHQTPARDEADLQRFDPTVDTRELYFRLTGITPELQIMIEERILAGDDLSSLLFPLFVSFSHFDQANAMLMATGE